MKLLVGLGNPGPQYQHTRHNAGFMALDRVVARHWRSAVGGVAGGGAGVRQRFSGEVLEVQVGRERCLLLRPMRFMNCSGQSVSEALNFYKLNLAEDLLIMVDDYALPLGTIRVRAEGGNGGHNGLTDVERALGTTAYPRLRIGVDPPPAGYDDPADWVLGRFTDEQLKALDPALTRAADAADMFITRGLTATMNAFNAAPKPPKPPPAAAANSPSPPSPVPNP